MNEPAFDYFGRQTKFWAGASEGINYAMEEASTTINLNGEEQRQFHVAVGANIQFAEMSIWNNTIGVYISRSGTGVSNGNNGQPVDLNFRKYFPPITS